MMPKTAIVTGAASGVGRACARMLIANNVRIVVMDIQGDVLKAEFPDAGNTVFTQTLDLGQPEECKAAVASALQRLGHVDALLHFAATWSRTTWDCMESAEWDHILAVNLKGSFFLCQAVARHMVERKQGCIVLTASDVAKVGGVAGGPAYVSSKGGIIALTHYLAQVLGPLGIRVNAINPGPLETAMTSTWPAELKQMIISRTPLRRLGQPEDIASVACFLASEAAGFMTGEVVEVNGGSYFD